MNEQEFGKEFKRLLDQGADLSIKQSTLYRLQLARRAALENVQPASEILNSGHSTSVYSGHDGHLITGKQILLLLVLFAFALVSTTYWQYFEKSRHAAIDNAILEDDLSIDAFDDLSIDLFIGNELEPRNGSPAEVQVDTESELTDGLPANTQVNDEPQQTDESAAGAHLDNALDQADDLPTDSRREKTFDEWIGSK